MGAQGIDVLPLSKNVDYVPSTVDDIDIGSGAKKSNQEEDDEKLMIDMAATDILKDSKKIRNVHSKKSVNAMPTSRLPEIKPPKIKRIDDKRLDYKSRVEQ